MPRPTTFDRSLGVSICAAVAGGSSYAEAAKGVNVSPRTLAAWLAKSRAGDPEFAGLAAAVAEARKLGKRSRRRSYAQDAARNSARWRAWREQRQAELLAELGPDEFWNRRLAWLRLRGRWHSAERAMARMIAEGIRPSEVTADAPGSGRRADLAP